MRTPSRRTVNLLVTLLCLLWGSTWIVIKKGLEDLPAFASAGFRFGVAGAVMAAIAGTIGRRARGGRPAPALWISLGVLNFCLSYGIVYWTQTELSSSGLVAVLWGVFPLLMAAGGHFFLPGERLHGVQWFGFVAGFAGLALLFTTDLRGFGSDGVFAAAILLLSPVSAAIGTTVIKKYGEGTSSVQLNRNAMLVGSVLLFAVSAWHERDASIEWTPTAVFSVLYLAVPGTVVTFGVYFWLLRYADAHRLSLIAYVTPAIALYLGWALGQEPITGYTLTGTALILSGVIAVLRGKKSGKTNGKKAG